MITNPRMPAPASGREIIACRSRGKQRLQVQRTFQPILRGMIDLGY